ITAARRICVRVCRLLTAVDLESTGPSSCSKQTTIGSERLSSWTAATERHGPTLKYDQARGCCPGATSTDFYRARLVRALRNAGDLESAASQIETLHTVALSHESRRFGRMRGRSRGMQSNPTLVTSSRPR